MLVLVMMIVVVGKGRSVSIGNAAKLVKRQLKLQCTLLKFLKLFSGPALVCGRLILAPGPYG